ncbi:A disintegrin and metalloproteinase with thrombospondin motifs 7 [Plecturocebus cupreus]
MGLIPAGAREIRIQEVAEAANFLALRSEDPNKYFLNGGWTIQWDRDYQVAGTTFTYTRRGNWENLTREEQRQRPQAHGGSHPGGLLFQESNPGVRYEYTIHREADGHGRAPPPEFSWHYRPWTTCTVTCGTGVQRQSVYCSERQAGPVDEEHCDPLGRPDDRQRKCSEQPCPARWWAGEWQLCSSSCGPGGLSRRAVLCICSVGLDEQSALEPPACEHLPRPPAETPCNLHVPCPATWAMGSWSKCSVTCGEGAQHRSVLCTNDTGVPCDEAQRPARQVTCSRPLCPWPLDMLVPESSSSGSSSHELFNEADFIPRHLAPRPSPTSVPRPAGTGNAIDEEALGLDPPGPAFVDDFYYDYNFINFHEDLSYGPFEDPHLDLVGTGDGTPPARGHPAVPSTGHPVSATEPPAATGDGAPGPWSPSPGPSQASRSPPPPSEPPPGTLCARSSLGPDVELCTGGTVAWKPTLEGGLQPGVRELRPTVDAAPPSSLPTARPPELEGRDSPLQPGTPHAPTPGPGSGDMWTVAVGGTFLPTTLTGLGHTPEPEPALSPGPEGQPESLSPEVPLSSGLLSTPAWDGPANSRRAPETQPPAPRLTEAGPPVDPLAARNASWQAGNWSECSTTCGLGAVWRPVRCSSGRDEECTPAGRPQPARRCHLRPCAPWHSGNWSKCSRSCGGGSSVRDVQCVDTRDLRPLRPFHCQLAPTKPPAHRPCGAQPCLSWYASSWRECSEACGGGEQQRLVTCPEPGLCEEALRPNATQPCNTQPCTQWVAGPWGQCSAPCGGGVQRRLVKCVNTQMGLPEEESDQCGHEAWPESSRPCGAEDCEPIQLPQTSAHQRLSLNPGGRPRAGGTETATAGDLQLRAVSETACHSDSVRHSACWAVASCPRSAPSAAAHALRPAMAPPPEAISGLPAADRTRMHRPTDRPRPTTGCGGAPASCALMVLTPSPHPAAGGDLLPLRKALPRKV